MTQPTVTLPLEVVKYLTMYFEVNGESTDERNAAGTLRAALDAPANPPCQMCRNYYVEESGKYCIKANCTDFDKFQALPPISLTKVTK